MAHREPVKRLLIRSPSSPALSPAVSLGCVSTEGKERAEGENPMELGGCLAWFGVWLWAQVRDSDNVL